MSKNNNESLYSKYKQDDDFASFVDQENKKDEKKAVDERPKAEWFNFKKQGGNGTYMFRFFPAHPNGKSTKTALPKSTSFMEIVNEEGEIRRIPVYDPMVHRWNANFSLRGVYADMVKNLVWEEVGKNKSAFSDRMKATLGHRDYGIEPKKNWVAYADFYKKGWNETEPKLFLVDITQNLMNQIISGCTVSVRGEKKFVNYLSSLENGRPVTITKDDTLTEKSKWYQAKFDESSMPMPVERLEEFEQYPSIEEMFVNNYKIFHLMQEIEGIERFDYRFGFGLVNDPKYLQKIEEAKNWFTPEEWQEYNNRADESQSITTTTTTPTVDELSRMNVQELRNVIARRNLTIDIEDSYKNDAEMALDLSLKIGEALGLNLGESFTEDGLNDEAMSLVQDNKAQNEPKVKTRTVPKTDFSNPLELEDVDPNELPF